MAILVTGGAGYIGSHTCVDLLNNNEEIVIIDNLCNSNPESLNRLEKITGKSPKFYKGDVLDRNILDKIFKENKIETVIHFAALKAVGESCTKPLNYYRNNISGTVNLLESMRDNGVRNFVFSSSATVYGDGTPPYSEDAPTGDVSNPYGRTKYIMEEILKDLYASDPSFNIVILRYFNPIGAHESGLIGEDPNGIPCNLLPYVTQVAIGKLPVLSVYGNDYPTEDGTCVRDYIHVSDLATGHLKAVDFLRSNKGLEIINLGTGHGYSVLQVIDAFKKASGKDVNYKIVGRRNGDLPISYADAVKAKKLLGFSAKYDMDRMCKDAWRWQSQNPNGYSK